MQSPQPNNPDNSWQGPVPPDPSRKTRPVPQDQPGPPFSRPAFFDEHEPTASGPGQPGDSFSDPFAEDQPDNAVDKAVPPDQSGYHNPGRVPPELAGDPGLGTALPDHPGSYPGAEQPGPYPGTYPQGQAGYASSDAALQTTSLGFGRTFSAVFAILKTRFGPLIAIGIVAHLVYAVVTGVLGTGPLSALSIWSRMESTTSNQALHSPGLWVGLIVGMAVALGVMLLINWWASLAMCVMAEEALSGQRITLSQALKTSGASVGSLIPFILLSVVVGGGAIGLVVLWLVKIVQSGQVSTATLGAVALLLLVVLAVVLVVSLWLSVKLLATHPVMVVEHLPASRALSRSWRITQGSGWVILWMLVVINVVSVVAGLIISLIFPGTSASPLSTPIVSVGSTSIVTWLSKQGVSLVLTTVISAIVLAVTSLLSQVVYRDRIQRLSNVPES
ncbi:MAG: glycerophosphoryl diester phosphodiesterase membrane domain-containing protein [Propionibacteriaceae bacterium]|nr:glycerophosphoryl diester phosphodiesterase membrane domain-containing protein [Propionibacteriaceae bacterium]